MGPTSSLGVQGQFRGAPLAMQRRGRFSEKMTPELSFQASVDTVGCSGPQRNATT